MDTLWSVILFLLLWQSVKIKYQKPTASILLNGETWDVFPSRTLTITSFKDSTGGSGQHYLVKGKKERKKERRYTRIKMEDINRTLFVDKMIIYLEIPVVLKVKLLQQVYQIQVQFQK